MLNPRRPAAAAAGERVAAGAGVLPFLRMIWLQGYFDGKPLEKHGAAEVEILSLAFGFQAVVALIRAEQVGPDGKSHWGSLYLLFLEGRTCVQWHITVKVKVRRRCLLQNALCIFCTLCCVTWVIIFC